MADDWVLDAVTQYERPLLAYVRRLFGDEHRGFDVVQDAFLQLLKQVRAEVEPRLAPWLFAVCRRRVVDILRKENRMVALHDAPFTRDAGPFELAVQGRETDRYGRALRVVKRGGRSLGAQLVSEGLAEPWRGRRSDWCDALAAGHLPG